MLWRFFDIFKFVSASRLVQEVVPFLTLPFTSSAVATLIAPSQAMDPEVASDIVALMGKELKVCRATIRSLEDELKVRNPAPFKRVFASLARVRQCARWKERLMTCQRAMSAYAPQNLPWLSSTKTSRMCVRKTAASAHKFKQ